MHTKNGLSLAWIVGVIVSVIAAVFVYSNFVSTDGRLGAGFSIQPQNSNQLGGTVTTANTGVSTTISTFQFPSSNVTSTMTLWAYVTANSTTGTDAGDYLCIGLFKQQFVSSPTSSVYLYDSTCVVETESNTAWGVSFATGTQSAILQVRGVATSTVEWVASTMVQIVD